MLAAAAGFAVVAYVYLTLPDVRVAREDQPRVHRVDGDAGRRGGA